MYNYEGFKKLTHKELRELAIKNFLAPVYTIPSYSGLIYPKNKTTAQDALFKQKIAYVKLQENN